MQQLLQEERSTAKPQHSLSEGEVNFWLKAFGGKAGEGSGKPKDNEQADAAAPGTSAALPADPKSPEAPKEGELNSDESTGWTDSGVYNPFPPGYADDLFENE